MLLTLSILYGYVGNIVLYYYDWFLYPVLLKNCGFFDIACLEIDIDLFCF